MRDSFVALPQLFSSNTRRLTRYDLLGNFNHKGHWKQPTPFATLQPWKKSNKILVIFYHKQVNRTCSTWNKQIGMKQPYHDMCVPVYGDTIVHNTALAKGIRDAILSHQQMMRTKRNFSREWRSYTVVAWI